MQMRTRKAVLGILSVHTVLLPRYRRGNGV